MKVAFLGLGAMGLPMAVNLTRAGHRLTLWNRSDRPLDGFGETRPVRVRSIAEAVHETEAVITMLADDAASKRSCRAACSKHCPSARCTSA